MAAWKLGELSRTVNNWYAMASLSGGEGVYDHRFYPYKIMENEALFVIRTIPLQLGGGGSDLVLN